MRRDDSGRGWRRQLQRWLIGTNQVAPRQAIEFRRRIKALNESPTVLVVGGGAIGLGMERIYQDDSVHVFATDVYASANTHVISDAHQLPFFSESFEGVWIQAVLEHVLDPNCVVDEIHRVLKPGGIVYAETPFMQQVHEGAYDFMRFTASGHRWLFRRFHQIEAGIVLGAGSALSWSIRYFWRAIGVGNKMAFVLAAPFFWLRLLDRSKSRLTADAAGGVYFFGVKSETTLAPHDMGAYYNSPR